MDRRSFLGSLLAAPAIVRAESLMPIWVPKSPTLWFTRGAACLRPSDTLHFNGLAFLALHTVMLSNTDDVAKAVRAKLIQPAPYNYFPPLPQVPSVQAAYYLDPKPYANRI